VRWSQPQTESPPVTAEARPLQRRLARFSRRRRRRQRCRCRFYRDHAQLASCERHAVGQRLDDVDTWPGERQAADWRGEFVRRVRTAARQLPAGLEQLRLAVPAGSRDCSDGDEVDDGLVADLRITLILHRWYQQTTNWIPIVLPP